MNPPITRGIAPISKIAQKISFLGPKQCVIHTLPATVPSSSTAGFDKTCYPSPSGWSAETSSPPPLFISSNRKRIGASGRPAFATGKGAHVIVPFDAAKLSVNYTHKKNRGLSTEERKQCVVHSKSLSLLPPQLRCRPASIPTWNVPGSAPLVAPQQRSCLTATSWSGQPLAPDLVPPATISACADRPHRLNRNNQLTARKTARLEAGAVFCRAKAEEPAPWRGHVR